MEEKNIKSQEEPSETHSEDIVVDKPVTRLSDLWKKEDYWAIWLGAILLIVGVLIFSIIHQRIWFRKLSLLIQ